MHGYSASSPWVVEALPRPDVERVLQCVDAAWNIYLHHQGEKLLRSGKNPKSLPEDKLTKSLCTVLKDRKLTQGFGLLPHFRAEPHICQFNESGEVRTIGRTDIEYLQNFCLVIEFKKLNGKNYLRKKYRTDGIHRFVSSKYANDENIGVMCGILTTNCGADIPALQTEIPADPNLACLTFHGGTQISNPSVCAPSTASFDSAHARGTPPTPEQRIDLAHMFLMFGPKFP